MPDNKTLIEVIVKESGDVEFRKVRDGLKGLDDQTKKSDKSFGSGRESLRGFVGGMFVASGALEQFTGVAAKGSDELQLLSRVSQTAMVALSTGNIPLALLGSGIGFIISKMEQERAESEALMKPSKDLTQEIYALGDAHDALGKLIASVLNLTGKEADAVSKAAQSYQELRDPLEKVSALRLRMIETGKELAKAEVMITSATINNDVVSLNQANEMRDKAKQKLIDLTNEYVNSRESIQQQSDALNEQSRQFGILKGNAASMVSEMSNYRKQVDQINKEHKDYLKQYTKDWDTAEKDAKAARIKSQGDTEKSIEKINEDLTRQFSEMNYQRNLNARELAKQQQSIEEDAAKSSLAIKQGLERDLQKLDEDFGLTLQADHTERELETIKAAQDEKREELKTAASERLKEIEEARVERQGELEERKRQAAEAFEHQRGLAIEAADRQIEAQREASREQIKAINEALEKQKDALKEQHDKEAENYASSKKEASANHLERMKQLVDTRTEQQRLNDVTALLGKDGGIWDMAINKVLLYNRLINGPPLRNLEIPSSNFPGGGRKFQGGTDFRVPSGFPSDTFPFMAWLSSGERLRVTPSGGGTGGGGNVYNIYLQDSHDPTANAYAIHERILRSESQR